MKRPRPSHATVVAYLALFIALGGGAYAITVPKNSVKSKSIKNGQVRGIDVRNNGLTGADVNESTLSGLSTCPAGMVRVRSLCVDSADRAAVQTVNWSTAVFGCRSAGVRLPSTGEAMEALPNPSVGLWTSDVTSTSEAIVYESGVLSIVSRADVRTYRCVATPTAS